MMHLLLSGTRVRIAVIVCVCALFGGFVALASAKPNEGSASVRLPVDVVEHFRSHPYDMPKWVDVGDKYVQRDGSGNETWPLTVPASARSVTMFLSCEKDVDGAIGVYDGTTAIGTVAFGECGGLNWSSGAHDVGPIEWPTSIQVAVRHGVRWKATIYFSDGPVPID